MSDLDDKLKAVLHAYGAQARMNSRTALYDLEFEAEAIAQIRQAFESEGWYRPGVIGNVEGVQIHDINGDSNIMTGQEFYERFTAEYQQTLNYESLPSGIVAEALEAARRAAGIELVADSPDTTTGLSNPPDSDWPDIQQQHIDNSEQS